MIGYRKSSKDMEVKLERLVGGFEIKAGFDVVIGGSLVSGKLSAAILKVEHPHTLVESGLVDTVLQCLGRRIPCIEALEHELDMWNIDRNRNSLSVNWQFSTADARIKLHHLYPDI